MPQALSGIHSVAQLLHPLDDNCRLLLRLRAWWFRRLEAALTTQHSFKVLNGISKLPGLYSANNWWHSMTSWHSVDETKCFQRSFYQTLKLFSVTFIQNLNSDFKGYSQTCSLDFHTLLGSEITAVAQSVLKEGSRFWNHQAKTNRSLQINKVVVRARSGQKAYRGRASKG